MTIIWGKFYRMTECYTDVSIFAETEGQTEIGMGGGCTKGYKDMPGRL
jgi:hypothetical protein